MNKSRVHNTRVYLLSMPLLLAPLVGYTLDIGFEPRISTGVMHYDYESSGDDANFVGGKSVEYDDELVFLGGGGTVFFERFFGDVYYQQSNRGEVFEDETPNTFGFGVKPKRQDFAASLGFNIWPNFAVFAGYKYGKTENDGTIFEGVAIGGIDPFPTGRRFDQEFEEDGPFVGAVYGWNFGKWGTLSINLAVAFLNADVDESLQLEGTSDDERDLDGDAIGVSYGVSWSAPITQRLGYSIKINGYSYNFDDFDGTQFDGNPGNTGGSRNQDYEIDENMIGVNFDIAYSLL